MNDIKVEINEEQKRVELKFEYDKEIVWQVKEVKKFRYDPPKKVWYISLELNNAQEIIDAVDSIEECDVEVSNEEIHAYYTQKNREKEVEEQIANEQINNKLKSLKLKKELFKHQVEAVQFLTHKKGALLGDDMGLGKTITAIVVSLIRNKRTLIIAPNSLVKVWQNEIDNICNESSQIYKTKYLKKDLKGFNNDAFFKIVNYASFQKIAERDQGLLADVESVILDESHYIKNYKAKRTIAIGEHLRETEYKLILSGTALKNRPVELFSQIEFIKKGLFTFVGFTQRYCDSQRTKYGWDNSGSSNLEELHSKLSLFTIRRTKAQVLDLPPKIYTNTEIDKKITAKRADTALSIINDLKKRTAEVKITETISLLKTFVEAEEKAVVFSEYKNTLEDINAALSDHTIILRASDSVEKRAAKVKEFQENADKLFFLSTIKLGSVGMTLTAASKVVFNDLTWSPSDMRQAEDRCNRIGQSSVVNVYNMLADSDTDIALVEMLNDKAEIVDIVQDGEAKVKVQKRSAYAKLLNKFEEEYKLKDTTNQEKKAC
jgi:SWI/SNF-related matrix-associated actin-dependent regulator of chromatin subfamily A-like protein 1